jgi:hypothetical protein
VYFSKRGGVPDHVCIHTIRTDVRPLNRDTINPNRTLPIHHAQLLAELHSPGIGGVTPHTAVLRILIILFKHDYEDFINTYVAAALLVSPRDRDTHPVEAARAADGGGVVRLTTPGAFSTLGHARAV